MTFNPHTLLQRNPELLSSSIDEETVLFDSEQGQYFSMDPVGSAIWQKLATPITFQQLIDNLVAEFDVTHGQCQTDTETFLTQLHDAKLITYDAQR